MWERNVRPGIWPGLGLTVGLRLNGRDTPRTSAWVTTAARRAARLLILGGWF